MTAGMDTKKDWAELHAHLVTQLFDQWREPLGIDGTEYSRCLEKEFLANCDDPLWKSLIESICNK